MDIFLILTARVVSTSSFVQHKACFRFFGALGIANVDKNGISKSRHFDMNQTFFGITGRQTADSQGLERRTGNPSAKLRRTSPAPDSSSRRAAEALTSAAQR